MNPQGLTEAPVQGGISVKPGLRHHNPCDDFRCRVLSRVDVCTRKVRISATTLAGYDASKVVGETTIEQYERVTRVRYERAVDPKWTASRLDLTS